MRPSARIRQAVPTDAAEIADVLRQSFLEFEALYTPKGFAATTPDPEQVGSRMEEGPAWIALVEDRTAGTSSAVRKGEKGLYVRGVAVVPSMRGRGIAEVLMNEVESFARQNGCARMFLTTTPFLTSAIRLYERFGLRASRMAEPTYSAPRSSRWKRIWIVNEVARHRKDQPCQRTMDTPLAFA